MTPTKKVNLEDSKETIKSKKNPQDSNKSKETKSKKPFVKPKKDFSDLMESKYVKKWANSYKNGQAQARLSVLVKYCEFLGKNPDEILEEHHKDTIQENPLDITNIGTSQLLAYYEYLTGEPNNVNGKMLEKAISPNSARQYVFSKLPSFFRRNNVSITFQKGEVPKQVKGVRDKQWRNGTAPISKDKKKECIKTIKDTLDLRRDKAILLCKISSGMDDVDLFNLKVKDFRQGYRQDFNVAYIEGYRQKVKLIFQTYFNSEAVDMLDSYLLDRGLKETFTDDSWLFVTHRGKDGVYRKIKSNAFAKNLNIVCDKLNLHNITPKSFRRWFKSELRRNRVSSDIIERMMGHTASISADYEEMFSDEDEFLETYVEEIEELTLLGNGKSKKMNQIENELDEVRTENKHLKNKMNNISELLVKIVDVLPKTTKEMILSTELLEKLLESKEEPKKEE